MKQRFLGPTDQCLRADEVAGTCDSSSFPRSRSLVKTIEVVAEQRLGYNRSTFWAQPGWHGFAATTQQPVVVAVIHESALSSSKFRVADMRSSLRRISALLLSLPLIVLACSVMSVTPSTASKVITPVPQVRSGLLSPLKWSQTRCGWRFPQRRRVGVGVHSHMCC